MGGGDETDVIVDFYRGRRPDSEGRFVEDLQAWDDEALEAVHDYIQWLFPLGQPSGVNPRAPLVTAATEAAFAADPALREALARSFDRMLLFYGLERADGPAGALVRPGPTFPIRSAVWLRPFNHNFLRLTRILACLCMLGLPDDATALFRCLEALFHGGARDVVGERTFDFWRRAAGS
jgi:Opioid growth factor receptor (OGFr) conserved region